MRTKKDLPHGKQCRDLFEVSIPERKFVRNERTLNLFLCDAQVEGVYESQVPLSLRGNNDVVLMYSKCLLMLHFLSSSFIITISINIIIIVIIITTLLSGILTMGCVASVNKNSSYNKYVIKYDRL